MVSFSEVKDTVKEKVEVAKEKVSDVVVSKLIFGFLQHLISKYVVEHNQSKFDIESSICFYRDQMKRSRREGNAQKRICHS